MPFDIVNIPIHPQYENHEGWNQSLDGIMDFENLPEKAKIYTHHLQKLLKIKISMVSTGPEREKLLPVY